MPQLQILESNPSFANQLAQQLGTGVGQGLQQKLSNFHQQKQSQAQGTALAQGIGKPELAQLFSQLGPDLSKIILQEFGAENLASNLEKIYGINTESSPNGRENVEEIIEKDIPERPKEQEFLEIYSRASPKEKPQLLKAYKEEKKFKEEQRKTGLKDTAKIRHEIATEGKAAHKSIESKERLIKLIEKGNLDNPLVVAVASFLPKGFRESLLSNDSLQYEAGLFDEFGVLKGMFPGSIRTAEINLLEPKLASLYKNDEAKKQILEAGINASKIAIIRYKKAAEIEREMPYLSVLEFENELEKRAKPEIDKLGNEILNRLQEIANKYSDIEMMYDRQGKLKKVSKKDVEEALNAGYTIAS